MIADVKVGQKIFVDAAIDFEKAVESDDFPAAFENVIGGRGDSNGGFFEFGVGHLRSKRARANKIVKAALVIVFTGRFGCDIGWADSFVGFLGASGFCFEIANF